MDPTLFEVKKDCAFVNPAQPGPSNASPGISYAFSTAFAPEIRALVAF